MSEPTTYDVVLLVEQPLSAADAAQVRSLHQDVEEQVRYHVLLPVEDAAARVESAMGSIAASEVLASPALVMDSDSIEEIQRELLSHARSDCDGCVDKLKGTGADVSGEVVSAEPIDALIGKVAEVQAAEVIILTRKHVVARVLPRRLDLAGPPQARRADPAPAGARELRRAGRALRRRRGHRLLSRSSHRPR